MNREEPMPPKQTKRKKFAFGMTLGGLLGSLCTLATTYLSDAYGYTHFLGVPVIVGLVASLFYASGRKTNLAEALGIGGSSIFLCWILTFALGIDGLIVLSLSFPLAIILSVAGAYLGLRISQHLRNRQSQSLALAFSCLSLPLLMGFESQTLKDPPLRRVTTNIEIAASPEDVWPNVLDYPEIESSPSLVFQAGVTYPISATMSGQGVGASRTMKFSTGEFQEFVTAWDKHRLIRFDIEDTPDPISEFSPYRKVRSDNFTEFLHARAGQYRLVRLEDGSTRLECTTWYYHDLWPVSYWAAISDQVIAKIHSRMLQQIKGQSEEGNLLSSNFRMR